MTTILVKNLPEDLLKELKRLKVELGCKTWAELLTKLVESEKKLTLSEETMEDMRTGIQGYIKLKNVVSNRWTGRPTALEETTRTRNHENK